MCRGPVLQHNCIRMIDHAFLSKGKEARNKDLLKRKERLLVKEA
jgi:hypothetical protein